MSDYTIRLHADRETCIGAGMCVTTAPDVFDQYEDTGLVLLHTQTPPQANLEAVQRAVACCPSGALTLITEPAPDTAQRQPEEDPR